MAICDGAHRQYDRIANADIQVGTLPEWTRIHGKVAWYVVRGPLASLGDAWQAFHRKVAARKPGVRHGPPGDLFICVPEDHATDQQAYLLTILYVPLEE